MVHRMECMFCLTDAGVYPHNVNVPWTTPAALCVTRQADFQVFVLCGVCTLRIPHFCPGRRVPAYPQPCNATRGRIVRGIFGDTLRMAGPALLIGGVLAAGTAAALRSTLLGVSPVDPIAFFSVGGLLLLVVIITSLGPALRASGIQPMEALRRE